MALEVDKKKKQNPNLKRIIKRIKRLRNYDLLIVIGCLAGIGMDVVLNIHGGDAFDSEGDLTNTIFNFITERHGLSQLLFDMSVFAAVVSALSYMGRSVDIWQQEKTPLSLLFDEIQPFKPRMSRELNASFNKQRLRNYASVLGVLLGIGFGCVFAVLLIGTSGFQIAVLLTLGMGIISLISTFAGLFSRLGQVGDTYIARKTINFNYELAIVGCLLASVLPSVFLCLNLAVINPLSIFILISSIAVLASSLTSVGHYIGRSLDFYTDGKTIISLFQKSDRKIQHGSGLEKRYEILATSLGLFVGLAIGIAIVGLGILMPAFLINLPLLLKLPLVVLFTMNMTTSIAARVGRILDRVESAHKADKENKRKVASVSQTTGTLFNSQSQDSFPTTPLLPVCPQNH